jgi:hypothetical protein
LVIVPCDEVVLASCSLEDACHTLGPNLSSVFVDEDSQVLQVVPSASSDSYGWKLVGIS